MTNNSVRGPMYVEGTALYVTADVEPLVDANAGEMLDLLLGKFFDDFMEIAQAEPTGKHDGHAPEKLLFEDLKARLVDHMSTKVTLTGPQAVRVAGQLHQLGLPLARIAEEQKAARRAAYNAVLLAATRGERGAA